MSTISAQAWKCDRTTCGHVWLSPEKPKRCAKCKSPAWDKVGVLVDAVSAIEAKHPGKVQLGKVSTAKITNAARIIPHCACGKKCAEWGAGFRCVPCGRNY